MAKYNLKNYVSGDGFGLPLNIRRGNPNPLDNTEVWDSLEAAQNYAATDATAYVGQPLSVLDFDESGVVTSVTRYVIQNEAGTLKPVGTATLGDDISIVKNEDDTLSIKGFADAETGAQPRKASDGSIEWIKPDTTTVEGLQTTVEGLESDIADHETRITANEEAIATLNGDGDGSVTKIAEAAADARVNKFAADISDDGTVNTFKELVDYVAAHGKEAADMAADILELQEQAEGLRTDLDTAQENITANETAITNLDAKIIETIKVNGTALPVTDKSVDIPLATAEKLGLVKSTDAENGVAIAEDGTMSVNSLNINKLVQTEGDVLVLDGGRIVVE